MEKQELIIKNYDLDKPAQMTSMAKVLKNHIVKNSLYTTIAQKNYVQVEGWQFAGGMLGLFPRVVKAENLSNAKEVKWLVEVELVDIHSKEIVSRGFALCSNLEGKKKTFDEYAILSMAQTRALGKAYRNVLAWVMKLAGYEGTPQEDMMKVGDDASAPVAKKPTAKDEITGFECHECTKPITEAEASYSKKIYGKPLCRVDQKTAKRK